jgi:hypothetical protein
MNRDAVASPNLRQSLARPYAAILCEEGDWTVLWQTRMLFQATPTAALPRQSHRSESA